MEKLRKVRKRRFLTLNERIEVIKMSETVKERKELAKHFGCNRKQIMSILQQSDRLLREWKNTSDPEKLQRRPSSNAVAVNKLVAEWVRRAKIAQIPITDDMIAKRALLAKKLFKYQYFQPKTVWLERFKRRFQIEVDQTPTLPRLLETMPECLKLANIFSDIKDDLAPSIVEVTLEWQTTEEYQQLLCEESRIDEDLVNTLNCATVDSSIVKKEIEIYDGVCPPEAAQPEEEVEVACHSPIHSDAQALECVRVLEEYSMLKDNYRAIGLIMQLERLFKGHIES